MTAVWKFILSAIRFNWLASPRLEGAAHLATAIAVVIGVFSVTSQNRQFQAQVQLQRELAVTSSWQQHMGRSMEYPEFAKGVSDIAEIKEEDLYQYIWFSENLIYAAEQITQYAPGDLQWKNTIIYEFRNQRGYLVSDEFLGCNGDKPDAIDNCSRNRDQNNMASFCSYIPAVRRLIREAFDGEQAASTRIAKASAHCVWDQPAKVVGAVPNA